MNRREFMIRVGGTMVAVPLVLEAVGCGDDNPTGSGASDRFTVGSSSAQSHTHSITFLCTDLSQNGATFTSTSNSGHTHTLSLTAPQLQSIAGGSTVGPVASSSDSGHTHNWTVQKPSNAC